MHFFRCRLERDPARASLFFIPMYPGPNTMEDFRALCRQYDDDANDEQDNSVVDDERYDESDDDNDDDDDDGNAVVADSNDYFDVLNN